MIQAHFPPDVIALKMATSIGVGFLVGFEREWSNKDAGVRTFALVSLLGMASALISVSLAIAGLLATVVLVGVLNVRSILVERSLEITTSAALLVTYILGVLAGTGHLFTPVAAAILMTMLLAWKTELRRFAGGVRPEEIRSAVLLGLIGFVIYPILPNRFIDPWGLINPREAWVSVIVVAGLGFFNYVLLRLYSTRGLYWSAILGGLVNSTAAIAELAQSMAESGLSGRVAVVNVLTILAMFLRNAALVAIFAHGALRTVILPLGVMAVLGAWTVWRSHTRTQPPPEQIKLSSPLSLRLVLEFGAFFLAIEVLGVLARRFFGNGGFLLVSAIGGFFSSASSTVAAANLAARGSVSPALAGTATVLASMASAVVNVPIVVRQVKGSEIAAGVILTTALEIAAGVGALVFQYYVIGPFH
jgi:uncharacterized membrane protein (DUF4010 family)